MQRNTMHLFLVSISLLTLIPHVTYCPFSMLEDSDTNYTPRSDIRTLEQKKYLQEKTYKIKQLLASLTPQNVNQKLDVNYYLNTPFEQLVTDETYHENMSPQEYEQHVDLLLELGADPCAESPKNWVLIYIASQGNYTIFKKIVSHIAPKDFNSELFKTTIIDMFTVGINNIQHTPDTLQILNELIDLGADIHAQDTLQKTVLFSRYNTPETLQFFLNLGVDPSRQNFKGNACLQYLKEDVFRSVHNTQALVKTLLLNQAFNSYHATQHPDGTTSPGWKDTLFGKTFVHACLQCFQGNPEFIKTIVIQSNKKASLAGKLEKLLKQDAWPEILIPEITSQLPEDEREQFLDQVPDVLKMTVATRNQANQESPE